MVIIFAEMMAWLPTAIMGRVTKSLAIRPGSGVVCGQSAFTEHSYAHQIRDYFDLAAYQGRMNRVGIRIESNERRCIDTRPEVPSSAWSFRRQLQHSLQVCAYQFGGSTPRWLPFRHIYSSQPVIKLRMEVGD